MCATQSSSALSNEPSSNSVRTEKSGTQASPNPCLVKWIRASRLLQIITVGSNGSLHWEMAFTRPLYLTRDPEVQHHILDHVAALIDQACYVQP